MLKLFIQSQYFRYNFQLANKIENISSNNNIHKSEILKFYAQKVKDNIKVLSNDEIKKLKIEFENLEYYNINNSYNDKSIENLLEFIDVEFDES